MLWLVVVLLVVGCGEAEKDWLLLETKQGPVRGRRDPIGDLYVFYNIPYATAPTGSEKFKAPLPPPDWTEPFDAIDKGVICPQATVSGFGLDTTKTKTMQEDCLIANIYVPDTKENNLSVVVYVHGGAFQVGFGDWLTPKKLMKSNKLIVVTFNYRIGIHGFLCLGTKDVQGNAGMKDQVALLRWVNTNIASFGGNPNDVTISGYSAGAVAVDLMILSKSAKGLFNKVIVESGASTTPFSIQSDPLSNAKAHAMKLNFTNVDDIRDLEEFYKTASYDTLTLDMFLDRADSSFIFSPCVESDTGEEVFLDDSPVNILKRGDFIKAPMLVGFADMEGLFRAPFFDVWKNRMNNKFSDFLPLDLVFETEEEKEKISKVIKEFYFKNESVDASTILAYVNYFTDVIFASPALRSVKLNIEAGNEQIYLFEYSFVDIDTPYVPHTMVRGATHCAETLAVLDGTNYNKQDESTEFEEYKKMRKSMRALWHSFITTGKPVPLGSTLWAPAKAAGSPHMSLGTKLELRERELLGDRAQFWNEIYEKHYRHPVPPLQH